MLNLTSRNLCKTRQLPILMLEKVFLYKQSQLHISSNYFHKNPASIFNCIQELEEKFIAAKIPEAKYSAETLVAHAYGFKHVEQLPAETNLTEEQESILNRLVNCRLSRMPLQYIVGNWDFRNLTLKLVPPIFIPRPESELLVGHVLEFLNSLKTNGTDETCSDQKKSISVNKILEIGCGSGAISLSLAKESENLMINAIDQNILACQLTQENVIQNNITNSINVLHAKLIDDGYIKLYEEDEKNSVMNGLTIDYDVIVSNPPYILKKDIASLSPEILLYEDIDALDGGNFGLDIIKLILFFGRKHLKQHGKLFLEIDPCHQILLQKLFEKENIHDLNIEKFYKDYSDLYRFVEISKKVE